MPRAEANIEEVFKRDLKSAPPDGFVVLRRMTYGEMVQRKAMLKLTMKGEDDVASEIAMADIKINNFEFARCIMEHNLTKNNGQPFNFKHEPDVAILDSRIGGEIESLISELHRFDSEENVKNFDSGSEAQ